MPSVSQRVAIAVASTIAMSACAASTQQRQNPKVVPYNPQVLSLSAVPVAQAKLFESTKQLLIDRDYHIMDHDANLGYIEACSPVDDSFGMQTREHWIVFVSDKEVSVEKSLQERSKNHWLEYAFVDRTYSYASETELLGSIAGAATQLAALDDQDGADVVANLQAAAND